MPLSNRAVPVVHERWQTGSCRSCTPASAMRSSSLDLADFRCAGHAASLACSRATLANCCSAPANRRRCRACGQAGEGVVGYQIGKAEGLKALLATTLVEQGILVSRHYAIAEVPTLTDWEFPVEPHRARHRRVCRVPQVGGAGRSGGPAARRSRGRAIRGGDRADPDLDRYGIGKIARPGRSRTASSAFEA